MFKAETFLAIDHLVRTMDRHRAGALLLITFMLTLAAVLALA